MEAVKKTVKGFPFLQLSRGAFAIASKVSKEVYEVDTLYGILMRGEAKIGAGDTAELLAGKYTPGVPLKGACPIVTDNHLGLHDAALVDWRSAYGTYAAATTIGAIIFAGDAEGFATWAKSKPCRDEVAGVPAGGFGERGADGGGVTRQQSIGPAQHRVLFVQDDRQTEPAGGHNRRHAGEPAEADHRRRRQSGEQDAGLKHAEGQGAAAGQSAQPAAAGAFGGDTVNRQIMAGDFERLAARVGDQHRPRTACQQSAGQSLGRKQMAAGAAGGEGDNRPVHAPSPSWTRRRVKASAMPIARASAISEEPP